MNKKVLTVYLEACTPVPSVSQLLAGHGVFTSVITGAGARRS